MKKEYISPNFRVAYIEPESIIAGSFEDEVQEDPARGGDENGVPVDATGGGDGGSRGGILWETW